MIVRHRWNVLVFLLIFVISAGWSTGKARADFTIEDEKKLGEKFLQAVLKQLRLVEDPEVVGYVDRVGQAIVAHLDVHVFPYDFYVP